MGGRRVGGVVGWGGGSVSIHPAPDRTPGMRGACWGCTAVRHSCTAQLYRSSVAHLRAVWFLEKRRDGVGGAVSGNRHGGEGVAM